MVFSFWRIGAMKLKCPKCHSFVFERFRVIEAVLVIAELYAFYRIIGSSLVPNYLIPGVLIGMIGLEYSIRYIYVKVQNKRNKNKY